MKYPDKSYLRKKLAHSLRVQFATARKSQHLELEAAGHTVSIVKKRRTVNVCA